MQQKTNCNKYFKIYLTSIIENINMYKLSYN